MKGLICLALFLGLTAHAEEPPKKQGPYAGIGVILKAEGTNLVVNQILPDSPAAAQKEMRAGDRIVAIAQEGAEAVSVRGAKLAEAVSLIRGPKGTTIRLTIVPAGEDESRARVVSFVRGEITQLSAWGDGALLTNGIAPDIELLRLADGASERLSNYAGKIVVLEFWATWCGPCQVKMAELQTYPAKFPDWKDQVALIAASVDDSKDLPAKHLKAKGWDKTHNVWVENAAARAYHIAGIPTAYVIDRKGKILAANPRDLPGIINSELLKKN
jgi:thiol-disulfide isomerase/thioredoxin